MNDQRWTGLQAGVYDAFLAVGEALGMSARRRHLLSAARGRVLEVGAGTGLNVAHYPTDLTELVLTEPDPSMVGRLARRAARSRTATSTVEATAEALPFPSGTFDTVVSTMVLCTVPDPQRATAEIRRVLRPGGRLLFIEHVRAAAGVRAWLQDKLDHAWTKVALGCHCNRSTLDVLRASGLRLTVVGTEAWRGMPGLVRPLVVGQAHAA